MRISHDSLGKFAKDNGDVRVFAPQQGELVFLKDGAPDLFEVIDNATDFTFEGKKYTRDEFKKLLKKAKKAAKEK